MSNYGYDYRHWYNHGQAPSPHRPMAVVAVLCEHCGEQSNLPAELVTLVVDPTEVQPNHVVFSCALCKAANTSTPLPDEIMEQLWQHVSLAAAQPLEPI